MDTLKDLFYGIPPIISIKTLYNKVKDEGVTYEDVKEFVQNQEVNQLYRKQPRIKFYFPIVAKDINEIWQIDIMNMSDIYSVNDYIKYFFVAIDVFSRFAVVVAMKNKLANTIIKAMKESFDVMVGKPKIINCDNGSEFINSNFKKFAKENDIDIRYVHVGDHKKLGIVDRIIRTLREKINKLLLIRNTSRYIDYISEIVDTYNDSYHSGIKQIPRDVKNKDKDIIALTNRKYNKSLKDEQKFDIGDNVRYIKNKTLFEKGSLPKWSKEIHEIIAKTPHTYLLDNDKTYKYYELQLIKVVDIQEFEDKSKSRTQIRRENKAKKDFRREDLITPNTEDKRKTKKKTILLMNIKYIIVYIMKNICSVCHKSDFRVKQIDD